MTDPAAIAHDGHDARRRGRRQRASRFAPAALALAVLACGLPLAWMGATPVTRACDELFAFTDERGSIEAETSLWPPGVRCVSQRADGVRVEQTYTAWYELATVALAAAAVWLAAGAIAGTVRPRRLLGGAVATAALFLVASAAFFL